MPGVDRTPGGGFHSIISNGARPEDNNFIVDGTDDNDLYYGTSVLNEEGVSGTPASLLPIDAIQEFSTQEHPTAEYGWKPGAVVQLGLKSGTINSTARRITSYGTARPMPEITSIPSDSRLPRSA